MEKLANLLRAGMSQEYIKKKINEQKQYDLSLSTIGLNLKEPVPSNGNRKIFIMRHGERVDILFGREWPKVSFDDAGNYIRRDLNMPETLPFRRSADEWANDTPITNIGQHQAYLTGSALRAEGVDISHVYASPALRSIQTLSHVLKGYGAKDSLKIRIEPGFYQLPMFEGVGNWLSPKELLAAQYPIDLDYKVKVTREEILKWTQNLGMKEHLTRQYETISKILNETAQDNILICSHGDAAQCTTRILLGIDDNSTEAEFVDKAFKVYYCSLVVLEEESKNQWKMVEPPIPPVTHGLTKRFDWTVFKL